MKKSPGFTLIELLVALAVFAVLAVMAYGGLDTILKARESTDKAALRLTNAQRSFLWLKRDLEQAVRRPIRGEYGETQAALLSADYGDYRLELTRAGYRNPARLARSDLQRVAYGISDQALVRYSWSYLDRAQDSKARKVVLLENVSDLRIRFMGQDKEWHENWPPLNSQEEKKNLLPLAIEIMLELDDWGRLTRVFLSGGNAGDA